MLIFTDAYFPYWLRSRVLSRERRSRRKQRSAQGLDEPGGGGEVASVPPPDLELQTVEGEARPPPPPTFTVGLECFPPPIPETPPPAPRAARSAVTTRGNLAYLTSGRMSDLMYEASNPPFNPLLDYAGIAIQFGYAIQFSVVWPPICLVSILHTMLRLRSNTLRLTNLSMRPQPEAVNGIGLWRPILMVEAWICVLINCLVVSVSTDQVSLHPTLALSA